MASVSTPILSGAQLAASVPADIFAEISGISADGKPDDGGSDTFVDEPAPDPTFNDEPAGPAVEEPPAEVEAEVDPPEGTEAKPPAAEAKPAVEAAEDLPEGVVRTKDPKYPYRLDQNRYNTIYGDHQLVREATEALGEPISVAKLTAHRDSYLAQENLYSALESADPASQGEAIGFMLTDMQEAFKNGEVGLDPTIPFAESVYSRMREQAPDAYAHLRLIQARDLMSEMFDMAGRTGNEALGFAAQHVVSALLGIAPKPEAMPVEQYVKNIAARAKAAGLPFYSIEEFKALAPNTDPVSTRDAELAAKDAEIARLRGERATGDPASAYQDWNKTHVADVNTAIFTDAVAPALATAKEAWKALPPDSLKKFERLVEAPLKRDVNDAVRNDHVLSNQILMLQRRAQRATSEQVRQALGEQIKTAVVDRAKLAVASLKGPYLKDAADMLKTSSDSTHGRRSAAQDRTAPQGTSTPAKRSVLSPGTLEMKNNVFDTNIAVQQAMREIGLA